MTAKNNPLYAKFTSFIGVGIFIVLLVAGLIFFSYLFIIGAIIGLILFGIAWIRAKFFPRKKAKKQSPKIHSGRTIDHDPSS